MAAHPFSFRLWLAQQRLRSGLDRARWNRLAARFPQVLASMDGVDISPWVTPLWEGFNAKMLAAVTPSPPKRFLRESVIRQSMFVDVRGQWMADQLAALVEHYGVDRLNALARETPVGDPPLCPAEVEGIDLNTSYNTLHHLYHLARYERSTGHRVADVRTCLEWGGGYGNLARIVFAAAPSLQRYIIVDTPLFCALQWLYLSMTLGEDRVRLYTSGSELRTSGCVIVPVPLIAEATARGLEPDMLISTWALSECSVHAQDFVTGEQDWFGAERLLLGYQDSSEQLPDAGRIEQLSRSAGCKIEPVGFLGGNSYAFR